MLNKVSFVCCFSWRFNNSAELSASSMRALVLIRIAFKWEDDFVVLKSSFWIVFQQNSIMRSCSSSLTNGSWVTTRKNFTYFGKMFCKIIIEPGILASISLLVIQSVVVFITSGHVGPVPVDRFVRSWSITGSSSSSSPLYPSLN